MLNRPILFLLLVATSLPICAQEVLTLLASRGTGQTTGHIITLSVRNNTSRAIEVAPATFYLPSDSRYQSYVGHIPGGIVIPPGSTIDIPASGYCTDVHTPPLPDGHPSLPGSDFVEVGTPPSDGTVSVFPNTPVPPLRESDLASLTTATGFTPTTELPEGEFVPNWPLGDGPSIPMNGSIAPDRNPRQFAPVIVGFVLQVEEAAAKLQAEGLLTTPFSGNPEQELEAVRQQATWLVVDLATGGDYDQEDFAENVYEQFTERSGVAISSLPEEQKEQLDQGVDDFWNSFTAVGVEAKVMSQPEEIPVSNPEPESPPEEDNSGCIGDMSVELDPDFKYDMIIDEQWGDAEERQEIEDNVATSLSQGIDLTTEEAALEYDISSNPTSSTSFWKAGTIGGFASAHAKTSFSRPDGGSEWVWGTDRMETSAGGTMKLTMTYTHDEHCRSLVAGTAVIRVKATSSAFDAMAGNTESENDTDQLDFLWWTQFAGSEATNWLVARARGRTDQSFREHMTEQVRDQVEGEVTDALQEELMQQAEQHLEGVLDELGLGDLDLADLELPDFELPNLRDLFEEATGIEIPNLDEWLSEGMEAAWNLPFVANTYATANGILSVRVGGDDGRAQANTSVYYNRQSTEETSEALRWSGDDCEEDFASDCQAGSLTIRTVGQSNMVAEAVSRYGFGNGHADAQLESMNLQILAGICICPAQRMTDRDTYELSVDGAMGWYAGDDSQQQALKDALEPLLNSIQEEMETELNNMSARDRNNLSADQFESMLADKVRAWAAEHPFGWRPCE